MELGGYLKTILCDINLSFSFGISATKAFGCWLL